MLKKQCIVLAIFQHFFFGSHEKKSCLNKFKFWEASWNHKKSLSWKFQYSILKNAETSHIPASISGNPVPLYDVVSLLLRLIGSAILHYTVNQRPHWACRQYGHTGGTQGWLGVERWQLCLRDTSRSANCHRRAAVGHWISLYVKCCRMVDSVPIWHTISIL